jgi:hypothetical protein
MRLWRARGQWQPRIGLVNPRTSLSVTTTLIALCIAQALRLAIFAHI